VAFAVVLAGRGTAIVAFLTAHPWIRRSPTVPVMEKTGGAAALVDIRGAAGVMSPAPEHGGSWRVKWERGRVLAGARNGTRRRPSEGHETHGCFRRTEVERSTR
jgi:hypothetical protein